MEVETRRRGAAEQGEGGGMGGLGLWAGRRPSRMESVREGGGGAESRGVSERESRRGEGWNGRYRRACAAGVWELGGIGQLLGLLSVADIHGACTPNPPQPAQQHTGFKPKLDPNPVNTDFTCFDRVGYLRVRVSYAVSSTRRHVDNYESLWKRAHSLYS
ncbi:unnamed protein product [Linum trigynum]|uniref:Uncharacterized protein n=1 Tax=Linum trigynum TaxID=586398 RepID=A0AAV2G8Z1_9ROSI